MLEREKQLQDVCRRRDVLLPRSLRAVQQHLGECKSGVQVSQRWQRLQSLTAAAVEARRGLLGAVCVYHACCAIIEVGGVHSFCMHFKGNGVHLLLACDVQSNLLLWLAGTCVVARLALALAAFLHSPVLHMQWSGASSSSVSTGGCERFPSPAVAAMRHPELAVSTLVCEAFVDGATRLMSSLVRSAGRVALAMDYHAACATL